MERLFAALFFTFTIVTSQAQGIGTVVFGNLEMPQFSSTLLGLMGISSGTYLGLTVPENKSGMKE